MARGKGANCRGTWSFIGGKRDPGEENAVVTAARETHEESMGHLTSTWVEQALTNQPKVLWKPEGRIAIYFPEVTEADDVADSVWTLPAGRPLPLVRPTPSLPSGSAVQPETLAGARAVLDDHGGGPMLLSRFTQLLYTKVPQSRAEVKSAGSAMAWCKSAGLLTNNSPKGTIGMEKVWLARADVLEVDSLLWLPWLLLATRADYREPIALEGEVVRIHPYFARLLSARTGSLLREHFAAVSESRS